MPGLRYQPYAGRLCVYGNDKHAKGTRRLLREAHHADRVQRIGNAHVNRDQDGAVRDVLHLDGPYLASAPTAQLAAQEYLRRFHELFGITLDELRSLSLAPAERPEAVDVEYRFLTEKTQFDTTIVTFSQTCLGLPVWEAGVSVQMRQNPFRVVSAQSTAHADVRVALPSDATVDRLGHLRCQDFDTCPEFSSRRSVDTARSTFAGRALTSHFGWHNRREDRSD